MEQLLDKISKAPPAAKYGGILVVVALLTAGNWYFFIDDMEMKIRNNNGRLASLRTQLAEKQAIAQNLNELKRQMDRLEQQLAEALTELPERKDIDELLAQLNDIGKKSGLEISRIEPGMESAAGFYARIPVKMAVAGNYHEVAMFLQEIANMRRIINVNEIRLGTPEIRNDKVVLKSEFMATTFRFLDQTPNQGQNPTGTQGAIR
jgi:type IV pilus assembly protein PilO